MSVQSEITRIEQAKSDIISAIEAKGVDVPSNASIDDLAALVSEISQGGMPQKSINYYYPSGGSENYSFNVQGYDSSISDVDIYMNGMLLTEYDEYDISTSGKVTLTFAVDTEGNIITVVHRRYG